MGGDIILPWYPKAVHPNFRSRSHWARTNGLKKARAWAAIATKASGVKAPSHGPIKLVVTFFPPTARDRDRDNCMSACKAYFDGIADAWGVNDSRFHPQPAIFAEPTKGGKIVVSIAP